VTGRDSQRSAVYAAESLARRLCDAGTATITIHGSTITVPTERRFADLDAVQRYVDAVLALAWVRRTWPVRARIPVLVRERNGNAGAHYERLTATIAIPPHRHNHAWAMRELVVLHELAHHLAVDEALAAHGPEFVTRFTTLAEKIAGPEAGFLLRVTMGDCGVRMAPEQPAAAG
jgi:putative metallohydrolase (TIGR04338 family)